MSARDSSGERAGEHAGSHAGEDTYVIFVGNPGVGKSTLLNGLLGEGVFKSGVSMGTGMTTHLQMARRDGVVYGDTPGLDDIASREKAGEEIAAALRQNGTYRLVFVVTLESGRVRPADVATLKIVLDAIHVDMIGDEGGEGGLFIPYGIVVNKVTPRAMAKLEEEEQRDITMASMMVSGSNASHIFLNPFDVDLFDTDNVVKDVSDELRTFIHSIPPVPIHPENVSDLDVADIDAVRESMETELAAVKNDYAARETKLQEQIQALKSRPPVVIHHHGGGGGGCSIS